MTFLNKQRRASDVIIDLISRSEIEKDPESREFRQMIAMHQSNNPLKLLHYLAPKIPAIRHSPDIALQIRVAKTDVDCGLAACVIATLGRACELQDEFVDDILNDRRFEQLVECVMCGVDHNKAEYTEGLSIRDACRAAWGIALLSANRKSSNNNLGHVLQALSVRVIHVLSHRQELLKRGDMVQDGIDTVQAGLELFSQELAEDTASVLWTFACVKACTGQNVTSLVNLCAALLVQDPFATRKLAQEGSLSDMATDINLEIGANDAVERLAESEMETDGTATEIPTADHDVVVGKDSSVPVAATPGTSTVSEKSYVLDWLSPNELIDSLWAIALHGAKLDDASSEVDLCCEKALQTLAEFLQMELQRLKVEYEFEEKELTDTFDNTSDIDLETGISDEIAETVDRQKLYDNELAELSESEFTGGMSTGNENLEPYSEKDVPQSADSLDDHEIIPLRVTDAFELMSAKKLRDKEGETSVSQADKGSSAILGGLLDIDENEALTEGEKDGVVTHYESSLSPRDLCSLAWSVTELDGPHREVILQGISNMFKITGVNSVSGLSGPDLSNLCWSIAKSNFAIQDDVSDIVVKWIADSAMEIASTDDVLNDSLALLRHFSPHELGRLVWSLSKILLEQGTVRWTSISIVSLTYRSLITAGLHLDLFSSEDIAKIIWAFLSLTDTSVSFGWPNVSQVIGKLLASLETSLLEWENVGALDRVDRGQHENREQSKVFSFLGRSRFTRRFFDQRIENALNDLYDAQEATKKTSRLPLLRDIPVDPLTLCKLSSTISKLAHQYDKSLIQSGVLTRISLRLFMSHDGRLLRECPLPDLVRLAEAAALSIEVAATRTLTGQFTRKVLHILNEMPSDKSNFIWLDLGPDDLSGLLWSLGQLEATFSGTDPDRSTAHRRLHLVVKPYFPLHSLESFSVSKTIRTLNGLVSTQLAPLMMDHVAQILQHLEQKLSVTEEDVNVCILLITLSALRRDLIEGDLVCEPEVDVQTRNLTNDLDNMHGTQENPTTLESVSRRKLLESCDRVLISLTVSIAGRLPTISTSDLLKILSVLICDRLQCDELVTAIDACVQDRAKNLKAERKAASTISAASSVLRLLIQAGRNEPGDLTSFSPSNDDVPSLLDTGSLESTVAALDDVYRALCNEPRVSKKPSLNISELELSWSRELLEQYKRLDFKSGTLQSCLDQQCHRKMSKRALSRLLPVPSQKLPQTLYSEEEIKS